MRSNESARIRELEELIADLEARLPAHSVSLSMISKLEELEEELAQLTTAQRSA